MPIPDSQIPVGLHDRYGLPRARTGLAVAGLLLATLVALLLGFVGHYIVTHQVTGRLTSFTIDGPHRVTITYYVAHAQPGVATCVLRAQNSAHVDVGYAYVTTPVETTVHVVTYPLNTAARATTAEVLACASGVTPPRAPAPAFYPGQPAPQQPPPGRAP